MGVCAALPVFHRILHVWQKVFCEFFAEFHTPLVEGIYVPDGALDEHFVLIQRDEFTQGFGI